MKPRSVLPPKLTRPCADGLLARERLFALLERFRRSVTWIDAPPGSGKTSLVSSWIETRALRCLWYRVDPSDADPATVFHQLASAAPAHAARLPLFTTEHFADLPGFAQRFFKILLECMPDLEVVVFDDFQHVTEGSALPGLVRELARIDTSIDHLRDGLPCMLSMKLPEPALPPRTGVSVVVLSHSGPPPELARAIAYGDLTRLRWDDLRPTREEALQLAPSHDDAAVPRPIQIKTLGRFEVRVRGETLRHTRKAQRRVLDLLKALVALGPEGVSRDLIAAALWPDAEGDAARDAFEVTLHRLRKVLGRDDAAHLSQGVLHLDSSVVWVDALAFERLAALANVNPCAINIDAAERALALYTGPFLHQVDDAPWILPTRDRLRSRYVRLATRTAQHYEQTGAPERAADVCATALELEPLAEELYRRLMACLAAQGRLAEAIDAYRRCRQMLTIVLGIPPSRETEAVHATIVGSRAH